MTWPEAFAFVGAAFAFAWVVRAMFMADAVGLAMDKALESINSDEMPDNP